MGRPRRHSRRTAALYDPKFLTGLLPEELSNPNGCARWETIEEYQRAVADYLRSAGLSADMAPAVSKATGVAFCILLKNRMQRRNEPEL